MLGDSPHFCRDASPLTMRSYFEGPLRILVAGQILHEASEDFRRFTI
jgi:hypothetical protein